MDDEIFEISTQPSAKLFNISCSKEIELSVVICCASILKVTNSKTANDKKYFKLVGFWLIAKHDA